MLEPDAILIEKGQKTPTLLFVYKTEKGKIPVKVDYKVTASDGTKENRWKTQMNMVITSSEVKDTVKSWEALENFELIWGKLK